MLLLCLILVNGLVAVFGELSQVVRYNDVSGPSGGLNLRFNAFGEDFDLDMEHNSAIDYDNVPTVFLGDNGRQRRSVIERGVNANDRNKRAVASSDGYETVSYYGNYDKRTDTWSLARKRRSTGEIYGHIVRRGTTYSFNSITGNPQKLNVRKEKNEAFHFGDDSIAAPNENDKMDTVERQKRQSNVINAKVETLVMADYSLWQKFLQWSNNNAVDAEEELKTYFGYVIHGVHLRYRNIDVSDLNIYITLAGFVIAETPQASHWFEDFKTTGTDGRDKTNVDSALPAFKSYHSVNSQSLPAHDHAMAFTDYNLISTDGSDSVAGKAYLGGICSTSGYSVSVSESHGGLGAIGIAAHELGHNMGAEHDGTVHTECPYNLNNIMSPSSGSANIQNTFHFSSCSVNDFRTTLAGKSCLGLDGKSDADIETDWNTFAAEHAGTVYSADQQCYQAFSAEYGSNIAHCGDWIYNQNGYDLCYNIWCSTGGNTCRTKNHPAARGTTCGTNKWCIDGQCVDKSATTTQGGSNTATTTTTTTATTTTTTSQAAATTAASTCTGDYTGTITVTWGDGSQTAESCSTYIQKLPHKCQSATWSQSCCHSCNTKGCIDGTALIGYSGTTELYCHEWMITYGQAAGYCNDVEWHERCCVSCTAAGYP